MFVKNIIESAKMGDFQSLNIIRDRYLYIADKFYKQYSNKISKEKIYSLYDMIIEDYLKVNYPLSISAYIHTELKALLGHLYPTEKILISDYILLAKGGNKDARDFLINHYSYIVINKAKEYDYLEYEDLVQYGMIKLIETIDMQLNKNNDNSLFTEKLISAINIYFSSTLKSENDIKEDYLTNVEFAHYDELDDKIFKIELDDILNSKRITKKQKMIAVKYYIEGLSTPQICKLYGCTKQDVRQKVNKVNKKIRGYYTK